MTKPAVRSPRNVAGPFYSTGQCMACGAPEVEAPDLLAQLTDQNSETYFVRQPETPEEIERACCAVEACCVLALRYGGTDPDILMRLGNLAEVCDEVGRLDQRRLPSTGQAHSRTAPPHEHSGSDHPLAEPVPGRPAPPAVANVEKPAPRAWWQFWKL